MTALLLGLSMLAGSEQQAESPTVLVIVGAQGTAEYGEQFREWCAQWEEACRLGSARFESIGLDESAGQHDRDTLQRVLSAQQKESLHELWIVLIGHGTFDGRRARVNLRGPDVTDLELAEWLEPFKRPLAVVNCTSSSAPFINRLSGPNRVIVTATRSGSQLNFARFGSFLAQTIANEEADLDKDGQTSLLEAWLMASRRTDEYYKADGRLATEHSLLDDNGDAKGTRSDAFRGIRPVAKKRSDSLDGLRAHQFHLVRSEFEQKLPADVRARRDKLELAVLELREQKSAVDEAAYLERLEPLLVELAQLYESVEEPSGP